MTGEIKLWAGAATPAGYVRCDGDTLNIADQPALFAVIGTTYGGDGTTTFALPNLENRFPMGTSMTADLGETGGEYEVVLTTNNLPAHNHGVKLEVNTDGTTTNEATDNALGAGYNIFNTSPTEEGENLRGIKEETVGNNEPVNITNPFIALHYIIKL